MDIKQCCQQVTFINQNVNIHTNKYLIIHLTVVGNIFEPKGLAD